MLQNSIHQNRNAIEVKELTKMYGKRTVVDHIHFSHRIGETIGLLGPNGAGKSTTIRMLMGLSRPTSGEIKLFGLDLKQHLKAVQSRIGVVFERPNLFENLTAYQNLALFCRLYNRPVTLIQPLLERMELWDRAHDPVKEYSKGMRQRILILRALIHEPELLFLDEPCSGLDPVSSRVIRDYLLELKARGITILLTSHDMDEVEEICDWIGFINHGQMIVLEELHTLKARFGTPHLKVTYRRQNELVEEFIDPLHDNLQRIQAIYRESPIVSVHSTEASLAEIFRKLSQTDNSDS